MQIVHVNHIDLAFDTFGDPNAESFLLISGLGTQMIRWTTPFCENLASRGYRVIRFDNRDTGKSTHFSGAPVPDISTLASRAKAGLPIELPYTLRDMAADAIGLLDALSISRVHLVGRSMGGMIAQWISSEYPERVLSLTSIMSSTGNPGLPSAAPDVLAMLMRPAPSFQTDPEAFLQHGVEFARRIAGTAYPFNETACRMLLIEEQRRGHDPGASRRQIAALAVAGDRRDRLAKIIVPTLVIHGTDDPLIPPACGEDTATSIPGARLLLLDGMGHELPPELYERAIEAITETARRGSQAATS
jgi:pimeloyl-ACP methyl ester carboxylesterase